MDLLDNDKTTRTLKETKKKTNKKITIRSTLEACTVISVYDRSNIFEFSKSARTAS